MAFHLHRVVGSRTVLQTVEGRTLRIGRAAGAELRFDDTAVALEHAVIRKEKGGYHLTDLGSVTGTYVNGEPVSTARLRDGDEIGIGGFLLKVRRADPEDPLFLHVRSADAEPRPDAAPLAAPTVDFAGRYRLRRGLLSKSFLGLAVAVVALAGVVALPALRRLDLFRPGDLTSFHAGRIEAAACADCHHPWRGVTDARCDACHGPGKVDEAPPHHADVMAPARAVTASFAGGGGSAEPREVAGAVPCTTCHLEHLGLDGLLPAGEAPCLSCHRELPLADGVQPVFAASVPSFAEHPEIRLSLPAPDGVGLRGSGYVRVPVTDPVARSSDDNPLKLNHAKHLAPGLLDPTSPTGRVQLACADCHRVTREGIAPISYETDCARCHALTFDDRLPDRTVTHGPPQAVAADLFLAYLEEGRTAGSVREDVRRFLVPGWRPRSERERAAVEEVRRAELRLYESRCTVCHVMDLSARPRPTVAVPTPPSRWLPHAEFSHAEHMQLEGLECAHCHDRAATSTATTDVLLPAIATCTPCHVAGAEAGATAEAGFRITPGPSSCRTCHAYHSGAPFPPAKTVAEAPQVAATAGSNDPGGAP